MEEKNWKGGGKGSQEVGDPVTVTYQSSTQDNITSATWTSKKKKTNSVKSRGGSNSGKLGDDH